MKVERIELRGVTTHEHTVLDLPERGVVLVTGPNGAGKSSLIEAVPLAVWGKTLRKAPVWSSKRGVVGLIVDGYHVVRKASGASRVRVEGHEPFESTRHAQAWLNVTFGPYEQWRRMCVLTAHDEDSFTRATDAGRKRIVEQAIGAEAFERAYDQAKAHLREQARAAEQARYRVERAQGRLEEAQAAHKAARDALGNPPPRPDPPEPLQRRADDLAQRVIDLRRKLDTAREELHRLSAQESEKARRAKMLAKGKCPTCGRPFEAEHDHAEEWGDLRARLQEAKERVQELSVEARRAAVEQSQAQQEAAEALAATREWRAAMEAHRRARERVQEAQERVREARQTLADAMQTKAEADRRVEVAKRAAQVLSPSGVRARLFADALAVLEAAANRWLGELGGGLGVKISPTRTKADGGTSDAVTVTLVGAGGESGRYEAASGGERRRVDLAVSLAVLELAEQFAGRSGSTVFVDEAFESLDADGREAAARAMARLAEDRCVVVVTHTATRELRVVAGDMVQV